MRRIPTEERRARLVLRQRLAPANRASDALAVARSLVVLHSTDAVTVFLSILARSEGVAPEDVERTLYDERALVRMLAMRRTLWVVPREIVPIVHAAATVDVAARERRRLEQWLVAGGSSSSPAAWLARAEKEALRALDELGEASTAEVAAHVPLLATRLRLGAGTKYETTQTAASRILPQLAMMGLAVRGRPRGTWVNGQYRWTTMRAWLGGELERLDPAAARAELLHLWLAAFGPATEADVRWWTGWTARDARAALATVPHAAVELDGGTGFVLADDLDPVEPPEPSAALLPTLDATTMGWKERGWYLGPHGPTLFDSNGNAGPTIWWGGRVVGGWSQRRDGEIVYRLLEDIGADAVRAVEVEAERVAEWLGDVRFSPGFLPPFQRGLAA
jgi:Winged helix DNA-binding domain